MELPNNTIVVDASPIIGLAKAESLDLLRRLFGEICVTEAVRDEVFARQDLPGAAELETAIRDGWVRLAPNHTNPAFAHLGEGEATSLAYATTDEVRAALGQVGEI